MPEEQMGVMLELSGSLHAGREDWGRSCWKGLFKCRVWAWVVMHQSKQIRLGASRRAEPSLDLENEHLEEKMLVHAKNRRFPKIETD